MDPRGVGIQISCGPFSSAMSDYRGLKLCTMLASLSLIDVHIVKTGGSNNFSLSYLVHPKGDGGCLF